MKHIQKAKEFVKKELYGETTGHDYWHSLLVWRNAKNIGKTENADMLVVELAALLHDIGDWKISGGESTGAEKNRKFLEEIKIDEKRIQHILDIIEGLAFKGSIDKPLLSIEGQIVQDADRLEALGAIGIARAFASGQKFRQEIYNPDIKPAPHRNPEDYKKQYTGERKNTSINHFYEKLLFIKDLMNTEAAKKIAEERHLYMKQFLTRFYEEWEGKK